MKKSPAGGTRRGFRVFLGMLALGLYAYGCGMFDIREAVGPSNPGEEACPRENPSNSDAVLKNFAAAITCKLDGTGLYDQTLAETFQLILDELDVQELVGEWDSLNKAEDVAAQEILAGDDAVADSFHFSFGSVLPERTDTTAFYLDIPYQLLLIRQVDTLAVADTIKGRAELTIREFGSGTWALSRWVDERQDPYTSFGRWHAERAVPTGP
jgi:hypothetical protein